MPPAVAPTGRRAAIIIAIAPLVALSACSTGGQRLTRTGFLSDYSQMHPTKEHKTMSRRLIPRSSSSLSSGKPSRGMRRRQPN
jgi:hypothetical protein